MYYMEVAPDDCTCKLVNYSDYGGWYVKHRDPGCPHHGDGPASPAAGDDTRNRSRSAEAQDGTAGDCMRDNPRAAGAASARSAQPLPPQGPPEQSVLDEYTFRQDFPVLSAEMRQMKAAR